MCYDSGLDRQRQLHLACLMLTATNRARAIALSKALTESLRRARGSQPLSVLVCTPAALAELGSSPRMILPRQHFSSSAQTVSSAVSSADLVDFVRWAGNLRARCLSARVFLPLEHDSRTKTHQSTGVLSFLLDFCQSRLHSPRIANVFISLTQRCDTWVRALVQRAWPVALLRAGRCAHCGHPDFARLDCSCSCSAPATERSHSLAAC